MIPFVRAVATIVTLASGLASQPTREHRFEVASVKVHPDPPRIMGVKTTGARLIADAETVRGLIMWAYKLKNFQVSVPPQSPVGDTYFDIVAKADGDAVPTISEFREMLQALLADRFHLKVHHEMREMPVYALVLGKNGSKLKPSASDAGEGGRLQVVDRNYQMIIPKASVDDIVDAVANAFLDRPVVDRTGLTGTYDLKLTYTPDIRSNRGEPNTADTSIFAAVQEQLGLKLQPQKASVPILVVDHVEKPSEN